MRTLRVLLVVNPAATTTRPEQRDLIIAALQGTAILDVQPTRGRGHATELAAAAVDTGSDAVVVLGGDGTANEVVQALAHTPVALGLVPGGGANVLVRALGLPTDPVAATVRLLWALRNGGRRRIGLGQADDRWFTFNAGMGFDAAVVARVERDPCRKHRLRHGAFVASALREWSELQPRVDTLTVGLPDGTQRPAALALVGNTSPFTVLGDRALVAHPGASFDRDLDVLTVRDLTFPRLVTLVVGALAGGRHIRLPGVRHDHDVRRVVVASIDGRQALPVHVDGDPLPPRRRLTLTSVPEALDVLV